MIAGELEYDSLAVRLTLEELAHATAVGEARAEYALSRRWRGSAGQRRAYVRPNNVMGACGECAAAKGLGLPWHYVAGLQRGAADVGRYEVRTRPPRDRRLIVRPPVEADQLYLAVVQWEAADYELVGWCSGADALALELYTPNERAAAYWVPYAALVSMATRL